LISGVDLGLALPYKPVTFFSRTTVMRAEMQTLASDIQQSLDLLRRHL